MVSNLSWGGGGGKTRTFSDSESTCSLPVSDKQKFRLRGGGKK